MAEKKDFFQRVKNVDATEFIYDNYTWEEIYQAFKERMVNEMTGTNSVSLECIYCDWESEPGCIILCDDVIKGPWYCPKCKEKLQA
jgi:hypothetical protein